MTAPLVEVAGLAKWFNVSSPLVDRVFRRHDRQYVKAVDGVSFSIRRGETFSLIGESGCGKSTVARAVIGLYVATRGSIRLDGTDITGRASRTIAVRRRMQMIFQDPFASLNPRWRVNDIIAEPLMIQKSVGKAAVQDHVDQLLQQVKLAPADRKKYPHEFSGGQRQRISIARALASGPEFLICDEPTSALDVSVQAQILNLMKDLQQSRELTYLFISHNLAVVYAVSDRVGVMYLGRLVEVADVDRLFSYPAHPYTRLLLQTVPNVTKPGRQRDPIAGEVPSPLNPPAGCAFHPRCPFAQGRCRSERPELLPSATSVVACHAVEENRLPEPDMEWRHTVRK